MKDEILQKVYETDTAPIPRYRLVNSEGKTLIEGIEIQLQNSIVQRGTPYDTQSVLPDALAQELCPEIENPTPAEALRALKSLTDPDQTLSVAGKAADAAATGEALEGKASLLQVYPVGAIYMSLVATSPAELFGGTWERILQRFLFAAEDGAGYYGGSIGGEATHTLTVDEMPSHHHNIGNVHLFKSNNAYAVANDTATASGRKNISGTSMAIANGGGQAHNNMPPYLAVYMWKRVA